MATMSLPETEKVTVTVSPGRREALPERLAPAASARRGNRARAMTRARQTVIRREIRFFILCLLYHLGSMVLRPSTADRHCTKSVRVI